VLATVSWIGEEQCDTRNGFYDTVVDGKLEEGQVERPQR